MTTVIESKIEPFLFLYITEKCHLRCKHCYMGDRLEKERFMEPHLVREILSFLRISYGQYKMYLLGGEPTLHPKLLDILKICKEENYKVVITSNGLIKKDHWDILTHNYIDSFSFSFDGGVQEAHEHMRGKHTFKPLINSIKIAVEKGFQTRVIQTLTTHNIKYVLQSLDLAESLGVEMISFHYFTPTGYGLKHPELQISSEEWVKFTDWLRAESATRKIKIFYPPAFIHAQDMSLLKEAGYRGCTARNLERLAIFPDRRVYICSAFFDTDLHYGTFSQGRIIPRLSSSNESELTLVNKLSSNCITCPNSSFCRAGCAAYDYFNITHPSYNCNQEMIPICPLWSMPAQAKGIEQRYQELR